MEEEEEKERWDVSSPLPLFNQDVGATFSTMLSTSHVYLASLEPVFVLSMCTCSDISKDFFFLPFICFFSPLIYLSIFLNKRAALRWRLFRLA